MLLNNCLRTVRCCASTSNATPRVLFMLRRTISSQANIEHKLVPLSSISSTELGPSVLLSKETLPPGSLKTPHDLICRGVFFAKVLSLSSSVAGLVMIPTLSAHFYEAAAERPSMMAFAIVANGFLGLLAFTPFLLHFLAKRFPINVHYNKEKQIITTVHYDFFLRKQALRFSPEEIEDAAIAPQAKKVWLPLATCFVGRYPLLLSLDERQYSDPAAFRLLTKNVHIPPNHD